MTHRLSMPLCKRCDLRASSSTARSGSQVRYVRMVYGMLRNSALRRRVAAPAGEDGERASRHMRIMLTLEACPQRQPREPDGSDRAETHPTWIGVRNGYQRDTQAIQYLISRN